MQTRDSATRKTDRRTLYTLGVIKDSLLELLEHDSFDKITVASLCRQAEITRATFYLHFQSLDEVLNAVLDEALMVAESAAREMTMTERMIKLEQLAQTGTADDLRRNEHLLSPCQRVADNPKYRTIFQDPTLSNYVIQRIYMMEREESIEYMTKRTDLSRTEADRLFMMLVYGLFYMNRALKWSKDDSWYRMQFIVNQLIFGGYGALSQQK